LVSTGDPRTNAPRRPKNGQYLQFAEMGKTVKREGLQKYQEFSFGNINLCCLINILVKKLAGFWKLGEIFKLEI
jgi:hypothetical protein